MNMIVCAVCMKPAAKAEVNERVCPSCLADAKLGRLVRNIPEGAELIRVRIPENAASDFSKWAVEIWGECGDEFDRYGLGATPEEALERAGVKEEE